MNSYENSLAKRFKNVVEQHGDRSALIFDDQVTLTYKQLDKRSNKIIRFLQNKGIERGDCICINLDKTATPYCIVLACLKMGVAYFATDPNNPTKRVERIFKQCPPSLIFSDANLIMERWQEKIVICEKINDELDFYKLLDSSDVELVEGACPLDPAYIMFTSGSTGSPKGVVISHANLFLFIDWAIEEYGFTSDDIHTHINPIYFDNSVFDMYSTFFSGGALVPFKTELLQNPAGIVEKIQDTKCSVFFSVPSMLMFLQSTKVIEAQALRSLKKIIFGGEGYPKVRLKELYDELGGQTELINVYGPTECTCICSSYLIAKKDFDSLEGYPPIGALTANFSYYLLDGDHQVSDDLVGELCLGGPCVGLGYFNQSELTQKAFVQNPNNSSFEEKIYRTGDLFRLKSEDGKLWFVGRKDFQIKHQGHRIELEEIEHALISIPQIIETVVIHRDEEEISKIIAFVVIKQELKPSEIRSQVAQLVPKYMVPNRVHILDQLPKNANGKTDRNELREMFFKEKIKSGVAL